MNQVTEDALSRMRKDRERFGFALPIPPEPKGMKIWQLIQILCRQDPNTEVFLSFDGFPIRTKEPVARVYEDQVSADVESPKILVLTSSRDVYAKRAEKPKAKKCRAAVPKSKRASSRRRSR